MQRAARWPPCVPGSELAWLHVCVRQSVQGSRQVCAETERQLLFLLPWLTQETARLRPHTEATALRGVGTEAQVSQPRWGEAASREAPQQHIAASSKCCPGKTLCPCEELQQPGRAARVMPSTALRCMLSSKDRGGTRARRGPVCGHARTCCCTRCRTPCATRRPVSTAPSSTFTT